MPFAPSPFCAALVAAAERRCAAVVSLRSQGHRHEAAAERIEAKRRERDPDGWREADEQRHQAALCFRTAADIEDGL